MLNAGSGNAVTALETIRESSSSWGSTTNLQSVFHEANQDPPGSTPMTDPMPHMTPHVLQPAGADPSHHESHMAAADATLQSPSDSHSELAESVQLEPHCEGHDSTPASSVRSEVVSDGGSGVEPTLAASPSGDDADTTEDQPHKTQLAVCMNASCDKVVKLYINTQHRTCLRLVEQIG